jgi:folate-binding protein YgfZ
MRKNALFETQRAAGATYGIYHGWEVALDYGDPDREFNAACDCSAVFDASLFGRIEVAGKDRLEFLHRLTSNSLAAAPEGSVVPTLFLTDKGKMIDRVVLLVRKELVLLLTSPGREEMVSRWIDKFTITEDITLKNVTDDTAMLYLLGPESGSMIHFLFGEIPDSGRWLATDDGTAFAFRGPESNETQGSFVVVTGASLLPSFWSRVANHVQGARAIGSTAFETYRISRGIPMTGGEITDRFTPFDAGLESDISFTKGCYVGQEVIARLHTYQKVRRGLSGIRTTADIHGAEGERLFRDGNDIGIVTSVAPLRVNGEWRALAVATLADAAPGTTVTIGERGAEATVTDLSTESGKNQPRGGNR